MTSNHDVLLSTPTKLSIPSAFRLKSRQDPHSLFLSGACLLIAVTLFFDLVMNGQDLPLVALLGLIVFALSLSLLFYLVGARMSPWVGRSAVVFFVCSCFYFLSEYSSEQHAVTTMQEFPLIAFYLSWFVAPAFGRKLVWITAALFGLVMGLNPLFWFGGSLGIVSGVQSLIVMIVCFEFGAASRMVAMKQVRTDPLTKALNRSAFMNELKKSLKRAQKNSSHLSMAVIDFDDFKLLNDSQGHAAGDEVLKKAVAQWKLNLRNKDVVGRTGGDEFAVILERATLGAARCTMSRLCESSSNSWSWGVSEVRPDDTVETLFDRADSALYDQKRSRHEP